MTNMQKDSNLQTNLPSVVGKLHIGLPMWQHPSWPHTWFAHSPKSDTQLISYAKECSTVEGNTTFYSLPHEDAALRWATSVPDNFSFTFKFHQAITHLSQLQHCEDEVTQQLKLMLPLKNKLGVMLLQLPASFGPNKLLVLDHFLKKLPSWLNVAVEVRHLSFFEKGDDERALNQILMAHHANRIIMDTRALFTGPCDSDMLAEVRSKKPRVPVNVIATGRTPVVRFVGNDTTEDNLQCLRPWVNKVDQWRREGKNVYFFCHRPDNKDAPWLAQQFIDLYNQTYNERAVPNLSIKTQPQQDRLF